MPITGLSFTSIGDDLGSSSTDRITSDNTINLQGTFSGNGSNSDTIQFQYSTDGVNWTTFDQKSYKVGNSFNVTTSALPDGTYTFRAINGSNVLGTTLSYQIDHTQPVVSQIKVAGDNIVSGAEESSGFTVTGNVADAHNGTVQVQILNGTTVLKTVDGTYSNGAFSVSVSGLTLPSSGSYSVKVVATDVAGNVMTTAATQNFTSTACFMAGTLIATPNGARAVETLAIGDMLLTHDGRVAPIRWVGRNTVSMVFADKLRTLPIRVVAGALGDNVPARDLLLSPDHALLVGDVLVQAGALVNHTTIARETNVPSSFVYYHVELADHALILAEGAPAETFIDNVDRMAFDNWEEHERLYGTTPGLVEMDLPRAKAHRQVPAAVREFIAARAEAIAGELSVAA